MNNHALALECALQAGGPTTSAADARVIAARAKRDDAVLLYETTIFQAREIKRKELRVQGMKKIPYPARRLLSWTQENVQRCSEYHSAYIQTESK